VDPSREYGLLTDECPSKIETAFHRQTRCGLDLLGDEFAENQLFGKILGANDDHVVSRRETRGCHQARQDHERKQRFQAAAGRRGTHRGVNRFSSWPSVKSASRAKSAAGMAPARIT